MTEFERFYSTIYGERWGGLLEALRRPGSKVERSCFEGFARYGMDPASIRAARALGVRPGERVLDACAAPGGKTLILVEALAGSGVVVANELSSARRFRLKEVLEQHVPAEFHGNFEVMGYDAHRFGLKRPSTFDRVLLDAPCSSEAHLLSDDPEQRDWKESRTRQLAMRQYSLLCAALLALKPGGVLVYSTCSISPLENDGVIERVLRKKGGAFHLDPVQDDLSDLEATRYGWQIFPDRSGGAGPIFLSRLIRSRD